jgi:hypothetical protein
MNHTSVTEPPQSCGTHMPTAAPPKALLPEDAQIHSVLAHPVFDKQYACIEHGSDSLQWELGDALGTDCSIEQLVELDGRSWPRAYTGTGERNEDWYGWHRNVLSPCTCRVTDVIVNRVTNRPGVMAMEQASTNGLCPRST